MSDLTKLYQANNRYIAKLSRRNEPLEYWRTKDEYKSFKSQFKDALSSQAKSLGDRFKDHKDNRLLVTNPDFKVYLKAWVSQNLEPLSAYVKKADVAQYLLKVWEYTAKTNYQRQGVMVKAAPTFQITNQNYLSAINSQADYLIYQSSLDDTTIDQLYGIISDGLTEGQSPNDIAQTIQDNFGDMSDYRANLIASTETSNAMGQANSAWMDENGVQEKEWVTAGDNPCPECEDNEAEGAIPIDQSFDSGDDDVPAHPGCECYVDPVAMDFSNIPDSELWLGD